MRRSACIVVFVGMSCLSWSAHAAEWMLRVETSGRVCHVQEKTAASLGNDLDGPFSSRAAACKAAAKAYDSSMSDAKKCWTYGRGTVQGCESDGTTLPPKMRGMARASTRGLALRVLYGRT
jgi:hypothetical protein